MLPHAGLCQFWGFKGRSSHLSCKSLTHWVPGSSLNTGSGFSTRSRDIWKAHNKPTQATSSGTNWQANFKAWNCTFSLLCFLCSVRLLAFCAILCTLHIPVYLHTSLHSSHTSHTPHTHLTHTSMWSPFTHTHTALPLTCPSLLLLLQKAGRKRDIV